LLNRSLSAACAAGAVAGVREAVADERDGRTAGAGVVENVWTGAACAEAATGAGAVENTRWPDGAVTTVRLVLALLLAAAAGVRAVERGAVVRSPEAGAWLRATLGDLNAGAVRAVCVGAAAAAGDDVCAAGAGAAACGASTLKDAGAKPPVGRVAVIV